MSAATWSPPTVTVEREDLDRLVRHLRSQAGILPYRDCPKGIDPPAFEAIRSVRDDIKRDLMRMADRIEQLIARGGAA